jgi:hypothetical protein
VRERVSSRRLKTLGLADNDGFHKGQGGEEGVVRQTKAIGRGPDRAFFVAFSFFFLLSLCFAFAGWRTPPGRGRGGGRRATDGPVTCGAHRPFSNCPPGSHPPTGRPRPRPGPIFGRQFVSRPFRDDVSLSLRERPMLLSSFFPLSISRRKEMNEDKGARVWRRGKKIFRYS